MPPPRPPIPHYHFFIPDLPCAIQCPRCKNEATLDSPYFFLPDQQAAAAKANPNTNGVKLGGGFLIEKYPDEFPWNAPENRRRQSQLYTRPKETWGVCLCSSCGYRKKHRLQFPEDAYYKTEIRGQILWAWNRDQLEALRIYIASTNRKFTGVAATHFWFLRHIPKHFLLVKHRTEALKKLDRLLAPKTSRKAAPKPKPTRRTRRESPKHRKKP
jgi:hypothetical protein